MDPPVLTQEQHDALCAAVSELQMAERHYATFRSHSAQDHAGRAYRIRKQLCDLFNLQDPPSIL